MKALTFIQASDIHLNYRHYNLNERQKDFTRSFSWLGQQVKKYHPDFVLLAGDLFDNPHPSNVILEEAIHIIDEMNCPIFAVPGSHDSAYNVAVGSVLKPLHTGKHIHYLPKKPYEDKDLFIYGMQNYRNRDIFLKRSKEDFNISPPKPKKGKFNIFLFHQAVQFPGMKLHPEMVDLFPGELPSGFQYYGTGHLHFPRVYDMPNGGKFVQSPALETCDYTDYDFPKGCYLIKVDSDRTIKPTLIEYKKYRVFRIFGDNFSGLTPSVITEKSIEMVKRYDEAGVILVLKLEGALPHGSQRSDINYSAIRQQVQKALFLHIVNKLELPDISLSHDPGEPTEEHARRFFEEYFKSVFSRHAKTVAELADNIRQIYADMSLTRDQRAEKALNIITKTFDEIEGEASDHRGN
ncbi:MAG: metallophosphoesterase family protein [Candidatus Ranarchaeia archaeon]